MIFSLGLLHLLPALMLVAGFLALCVVQRIRRSRHQPKPGMAVLGPPVTIDAEPDTGDEVLEEAEPRGPPSATAALIEEPAPAAVFFDPDLGLMSWNDLVVTKLKAHYGITETIDINSLLAMWRADNS